MRTHTQTPGVATLALNSEIRLVSRNPKVQKSWRALGRGASSAGRDAARSVVARTVQESLNP